MHKSRLAGFIIDCDTDDLDGAARFWSEALGYPAKRSDDPEEAAYVELDTPSDEVHLEVQQVRHPSRVHLDIETDDIEAEVRRLERLGAKRVEAVKTWVVMEAPSGQRFCVVPPQRADFDGKANEWRD
jgi:predicted enzyme related to lactoylglutathione lyase